TSNASFACSKSPFRRSDTLAERISKRLFGIRGGRTMAVAMDATAVTNFTTPESQYKGTQRVQISIKWVAPQAIMNTPNPTNIQENGTSPFARRTNWRSVSEMKT